MSGNPCDWDGDSYCAAEGCRWPGTHQNLTAMAGASPVYELLCCWHATQGPFTDPPDWGKMHRHRLGTMEARQTAARAQIEAMVALRDEVAAGHPTGRRSFDGYREEWPELWARVDAVIAAMEGWK